MKIYFYYGYIETPIITKDCCGLVSADNAYAAFNELKKRYVKDNSNLIIKYLGVVE